MASELMCPHCGWKYDPDVTLASSVGISGWELVPPHAYPATGIAGRLCLGSEQQPRNPETETETEPTDMRKEG